MTGDLCTLADVKTWLDIGGRAVTGITKANPAVVTSAAHNFKTGMTVGFSDVASMVQINGLTGRIAVIDPNNFSVAIDSRAFSAYTSGGFVGPDDALLQKLITAASEFIRQECAREFDSAERTGYYSGDGGKGQRLITINSPITAVKTLTIDGVTIPAASGFGSAGYSFVPNGFYISLTGHQFTQGVDNIVLVYTAGYTIIPYDLAEACWQLAGYRFAGKSRIGHVSKSLGGETVSFEISDVPKNVRQVIERYSRPMPVNGTDVRVTPYEEPPVYRYPEGADPEDM
jgi:hypothetical protein